jgi:hypothetical protein
LKNKKPFGNPIIAAVWPNHNSYNRRYPNGKEAQITGKAAFVKGFVKIAPKPEKSMLPRFMRPARSN